MLLAIRSEAGASLEKADAAFALRVASPCGGGVGLECRKSPREDDSTAAALS